MSYCAFQIFDKTMQLSSVPFLGSEEGPQVVMSSILATLAPGDILSASVLVQIDRQFVVGNALGAAPRNGIQYTIVQIG
jgi:hypothetical protein